MNNFSKKTETTTITTTFTQTKVVEQQSNHSPEPTNEKVHPVVMTIILSILDVVARSITGEVITAIRTAFGF